MLACLECSRSAEAINAYDVFKSGNRSAASEWQWGGGDITAVETFCRDLALRAMGGVKKGGQSQDAIMLFRNIISEGHPVSSDALLGLARSMENDGDFKSSVAFLRTFTDEVYKKENTSWQVVSGRSINANDEKSINPMEKNRLLADILASVMRVCNVKGQHGLAILMCSIVNKSYVSKKKRKRHGWPKCSVVVNAAVSQKIILENQQISEAFLQSFYELGCRHYADELSIKLKNVLMPRRLRQIESAHPESWINAFVAIDRVNKAMNAIELEDTCLSGESRLLFERGLSRAMEHCIDSNQPAAALELFVHASATLVKKDASLSERVRSLFGIENSYYGERYDVDDIFQHADINLKNLGLSDPLLAAIIKAYSRLGKPQKARSAFNDGMLQMDIPTLMTQSNNSVLNAIDIEEVLGFVQTMDASCVNPSTYSTVARRYAQIGAWPKIGEVYNIARAAGCISEELCLFAMKAVSESELQKGKITILRRKVDDVSGLVSMKSNDWIKTRYWTIKKNVGFHYARVRYAKVQI